MKGRQILAILLGCAFVAVSFRTFAKPVLEVADSSGSWSLAGFSEFACDPQRSFTPEQVSAPDSGIGFLPLTHSAVNLGIGDRVCWFRFRLTNSGNLPVMLCLEFDNPRLDLVELFIPTEGGGFDVQRAGVTVPFDEHSIPSNRPSFPITLAPGQTIDPVCRVAHRGTYRFGLRLWNWRDFSAHRSRGVLILGLFYGALVAVALHSVLVFALLRDRTYFYHVLLISSLLFYELTFHSTASQYFWPQAAWWSSKSVIFAFGIAACCIIGFSRSFLVTKQLTPRLDKVLITLMVFIMVAMCAHLFIWVWPNYLLQILAFFGALLMLYVAGWSLARGNRAARYYLGAWGTMLFGTLGLLLMGWGWLPQNLVTENAVHIGVAISPVLFSLALADRIRNARDTYRRELEWRVEERTRELQEALDSVKTLRGLIPMCSKCKKIRDDKGYWNSLEAYLHEHSEADLTHSLCPDCLTAIYAEESLHSSENHEQQAS